MKRIRAMVMVVAMSASSTVMAADTVPGDWSFSFALGVPVYTHRFALEGFTAQDTTPADQLQLTQFPGGGIYVHKRVRIGLNLQISEALTNPPKENSFVAFAFLPQVNWNFWGPLTASVVPTFFVRLAGINQFAYNTQFVFQASLPLGKGFSGFLALEIPVFFYPYISIGLTPLIGVSYHLKSGKRPIQ